MITGTHFAYYQLCRRKLWLFANGINMEQESDLVYEGKLIHEESYPERSSKYEEVAIHEIKKSNKVDRAHEWQLKYYMYVFEQHGVTNVRGILEYPEMRKTKEVILTDVDREEISSMISEIESIIQKDECPPRVKKGLCRNCSYFDFCYSEEPDEASEGSDDKVSSAR